MPDTAPASTPAPAAAPATAAPAASTPASSAPVSDSLMTGNVAAPATQAEPAKAQAPVVPEKYEFAKPKEGALHADDETALIADAKALGLTQEQAQKLYDTRHASIKAEVEAMQAENARTRAGWVQELMNDPKYGGQNFERNKLAVNSLISKAGESGKQLAALLKAEGLDAHPVLFRFMADIGARSSEGTWLNSNSTAVEQRPANAPFNPAADAKLFFGSEKKT